MSWLRHGFHSCCQAKDQISDYEKLDTLEDGLLISWDGPVIEIRKNIFYL